jgi:hypothetical protein
VLRGPLLPFRARHLSVRQYWSKKRQGLPCRVTLMRWLVIVVIIYAAVSMLRSAEESLPESSDAEVEFHP